MTWKATAKPRGCRGAGSGVPTAGERAAVGDLSQVDPPHAPDSSCPGLFPDRCVHVPLLIRPPPIGSPLRVTTASKGRWTRPRSPSPPRPTANLHSSSGVSSLDAVGKETLNLLPQKLVAAASEWRRRLLAAQPNLPPLFLVFQNDAEKSASDPGTPPQTSRPGDLRPTSNTSKPPKESRSPEVTQQG